MDLTDLRDPCFPLRLSPPLPQGSATVEFKANVMLPIKNGPYFGAPSPNLSDSFVYRRVLRANMSQKHEIAGPQGTHLSTVTSSRSTMLKLTGTQTSEQREGGSGVCGSVE